MIQCKSPFIYHDNSGDALTRAEEVDLVKRLRSDDAPLYLRLRGQTQGCNRLRVTRLRPVPGGYFEYYHGENHRTIARAEILHVATYALDRSGRFIATLEQLENLLVNYPSATYAPSVAPAPIGAVPFVAPAPPSMYDAVGEAKATVERAEAALASAIQREADRAAAAEAQKVREATSLDLTQDANEVQALALLIQDITSLERDGSCTALSRALFIQHWDFSSLHSYAAYYGYKLVKVGNGQLATLVKDTE